jgi:hypothetical protein
VVFTSTLGKRAMKREALADAFIFIGGGERGGMVPVLHIDEG